MFAKQKKVMRNMMWNPRILRPEQFVVRIQYINDILTQLLGHDNTNNIHEELLNDILIQYVTCGLDNQEMMLSFNF